MKNARLKMRGFLAERSYTKTVHPFFGLRRSGNHAIGYWLFGQYPKPSWYSDANNDSKQLVGLKRTYYSGAIGGLEFNRGMATFEEFSLPEMRKALAFMYRVIKKVDTVSPVLILRDCYNWVASRLHWSIREGYSVHKQAPWFVCDKQRMELWKDYARLFIDETSVFDKPLVCINYNTWFVDSEYRRNISEVMGLEFNDKLLNFTGPEGEGSSFEKETFQGKAQKMKVLDRWKMFAEPSHELHDFYVSLFDDEIRDLNDAIFDFNPLGSRA